MKRVCQYCGDPLPPIPHKDHIIPKSKGGSNSEENKRLSCYDCNITKGRRSVEQFRKYIQDSIKAMKQQRSFRYAKNCGIIDLNTEDVEVKFYYER